MTSRLVRLTADLRGDFAAYLDGELDEAAVERIESALAQSEVARSDMEALAQTYEWLDLLERPQASAEFLARTMAAVRTDGLKSDPRDTRWYRTGRSIGVVAAWGAALAATALLAFLSANRWIETPSDRLVEELPLIEQLDLYTEVGGIEILQRLSAQERLLQEMAPFERPAAEGGVEE
jgi:hypothetical protein